MGQGLNTTSTFGKTAKGTVVKPFLTGSSNKGMKMKKLLILIVILIMSTSLSACSGITHCKECDDEVYKDGYCQYHYTINAAKDAVDDAAKGVFDSIFGN